jgi:DNA-binding NtrC family response regulator
VGKVLIVDDSEASARYAALTLTEAGHEVRCAANGVEALTLLGQERVDLVLSDLRMPQMDGLELLEHLRASQPNVPVILISVDEDVQSVVHAVRGGAVNYLLKPCAPERLRDAVERALGLPRELLPEGGPPLERIVGQSRSMVEVRRAVLLAARTEMPVLITGQTGTGKEIVARAIHALSKRSTGPFVAHNSALAPRELVDSLLFGHRRGAFTGADRDQTGLFERASGGVLFLDELEAMSSDLQAKLLRVLDDGEVLPIGSTKSTHVSLRIVAATNREPRQMIADGTLRADLFWRLCGLEIGLAPLRDRAEDVPLLARHFLGEGHPGLSPEAAEVLRSRPWPGNVRELRNAILLAQERARGGRIEPRHLSVDVSTEGERQASYPTLRESELEAIRRTLIACDGNQSRAARILGIDRATLRRKLSDRPVPARGRAGRSDP